MTDAIGLIGQQLRLSDIAVEPILPERCREVIGHAVQLEQVLFNLITNSHHAIEATRREPGDRRKISLIVEDEGQEDKVTLTVKDTGGGIPEAAMSRIFEPFFTRPRKLAREPALASPSATASSPLWAVR